jgi:hypothetical protein
MANTIIQIKRSQSTATPGTLNYGELAYSFNSGKIFIGDQSGNAIAIGGNTYNQLVDSATSANTINTIVKRDGSGAFSATTVYAELSGNASTSSKWQTARLIGVSGDATGQVSVDGTANANVPLTLSNTGVSASTYGGGSQIPVITVDSKGRITVAANSELIIPSNSFTINGDTGSDTFTTGQTLTFAGGDGIDTIVTDNKVTINVDSTLIRTTGDQSKTGNFTIVGNLNVTGNTVFTGNTSYINIEQYKVSDPLIYLAANNYTSDVVAIGFAANYFDGASEMHTGLFRMPQSNTYYLFTGVTDELSANNAITPTANGFTRATLVANINGGTVSNLVSALATTDGGTGLNSYTTGDILYANATDTLTTLSAVATGNVLVSGTSPSWGKIGLTTHVSGVLPIANGGTNAASIGSAGTVAYSNGTSYLFNTAGSSGQALISGGSGAPTFGVLDLVGGGLGFTTPNANSVVFYGGTGNSMSYTNSASQGNVLQYTSSGVQFGMLDGGSF